MICQLKEKKYIYYSRSLKREIRQQLLKLGIVKPCQATCAIKNLLGDASAAENEGQREILERLNIAVAVGEEIIVDLRCNNGRKPKFDEFWDIVADHISDKTAVNDRRHSAASSTETNVVVVNMVFALSYADLYRTCVKLAQEKNIDTIPSYAWFLLQFWPTHRSASRLLRYTGWFRVRRDVQARILRKANPDAHYARTDYKFLKERAIKHRLNTVFFNADAKCKISVGEPGFPLAAVARGEKVIIGSNQNLKLLTMTLTSCQ